MEIKRVGILRGGEDKGNNNYENSLREGAKVISNLFDNSRKYKTVDIFIDKNGIWHADGLPIVPADLREKTDVVWNASHPSYSKILENLLIRNIRTSYFSSALGNSRAILEENMKKIGVEMPQHFVIPSYQEDFDGSKEEFAIGKAREVFEKFSAPWIVKSFTDDLDIGIHVAKTFPELIEAITDVANHGKSILVEELITGRNAFVHSVAGFRGEDIYVFPTGKFSPVEKEKLNNLAKKIHNNLGGTFYLKLNFVVNPKKGIYLTSVEFLPDLALNSHFNKMCESVGTKMYQVTEHILDSA